MPESDKRMFLRFEAREHIQYALLDKTESSVIAETRNMSAGGIRIAAASKLTPGDMLRLIITIPSEQKPVEIIGMVAWQSPDRSSDNTFDTGIQYSKISALERQKLTTYILTLLKQKTAQAHDAALVPQNNSLLSILTKEIRLPGDHSVSFNPADVLSPQGTGSDKVRYCGIKTSITLKCRMLDGSQCSVSSLSQYLSGAGVWLLLDSELAVGFRLELTIDIPDDPVPLITIGEVSFCRGEMMCDDTGSHMYYQVNVQFTGITANDRRRIVRYVYACRHKFLMLGKDLPPNWI